MSPVIVHPVARAPPEQVVDVSPLTAVATNPVIGEPPSSLGAVHPTTISSWPGIAAVRIGASATVNGVAESPFDTGELPTVLVATTDTA